MLSPGKIRSLQRCATPQGIFTILAADHRDSLRAVIVPDAPETVTAEQLTDVKLAIVEHLSPLASAVLLDPLYSAGQSIVSGKLPGCVGLLCALEEQGYLGDPLNRQTTLLVGWSVEKVKRMGADGVKILLPYHPDAGAAAEAQERLVSSTVADCRRYGIPFFLEPISYSLNSAVKKGSPEFAAQRHRVTVESVRRLGALGPDVLKVEFPVDVQYETDQRQWAEACVELNETSPVPWALLSAGEPFSTFKEQLRVACQAGCSGFVAGRAIWQEAAELSAETRASFLAKTARQRLIELSEIAVTFGMPWRMRYSTAHVDEYWSQ